MSFVVPHDIALGSLGMDAGGSALLLFQEVKGVTDSARNREITVYRAFGADEEFVDAVNIPGGVRGPVQFHGSGDAEAVVELVVESHPTPMGHRQIAQKSVVAHRFAHCVVERIDKPGHIFQGDAPHLVVEEVVDLGQGIPEAFEVVDEQEVVGQGGGGEAVAGTILGDLSGHFEIFELISHFEMAGDRFLGQEETGETRFHDGEIHIIDVGKVPIGHGGDDGAAPHLHFQLVVIGKKPFKKPLLLCRNRGNKSTEEQQYTQGIEPYR